MNNTQQLAQEALHTLLISNWITSFTKTNASLVIYKWPDALIQATKLIDLYRNNKKVDDNEYQTLKDDLNNLIKKPFIAIIDNLNEIFRIKKIQNDFIKDEIECCGNSIETKNKLISIIEKMLSILSDEEIKIPTSEQLLTGN